MHRTMEPLQTMYLWIALLFVPAVLGAGVLVARTVPAAIPGRPYTPSGRILGLVLGTVGILHVLVGIGLAIAIDAPGAITGGLLVAASGGFWGLCAYAGPIARSMAASRLPARLTSSSSSE